MLIRLGFHYIMLNKMQLIQAGERETEAKSWIESVFEEEIFEGESFQEELKVRNIQL